jgi:long-chain acyl-CoA synthetase
MAATFDAWLATRARETPGAVALEDATGSLTYGDVDSHVDRTSARLAALDLGAEPRIVVVAENSAAHLLTAFAIWRSGATLVSVYPSSTVAELEYALAHSRPALVISGESVMPAVEGVARGLGQPLVTLAATGDIDGLPIARPHDRAAVDADGLALICYTSGSTARPKAVMHSHRGLLAAARAYAAVWHLQPSDVNLVSMPLAWAFGLVTTSMATLTAGGRVVLFARSDPRALLAGFASHGVTFFAGVTTMFVRMVEAMESDPSTARPRSLRLCISGGEPRNEAAFARWHELTGCPVHDVYAASECFPVVTYDPTVDPLPRPGSAGRVVPEARMRIVDAAGHDAEPGKAGEALTRGPALMLGYWDDPSSTEAALTDDGWYRTGDLLEIGADGYVRVLGRLTDVIIRAGANVSPAEVEAALVRHPQVAEAGVVGLSDPVTGEAVVAAVVPEAGVSAIDIDDLNAHCAVALAGFKRPSRVVVMAELPRTASTGKVNRRALKAWLAGDRTVAAVVEDAP